MSASPETGSEGREMVETWLARVATETLDGVATRAQCDDLIAAIDAALAARPRDAATPAEGEKRLCLVCAYEKPWGLFDPATGIAVCMACKEAPRRFQSLLTAAQKLAAWKPDGASTGDVRAQWAADMMAFLDLVNGLSMDLASDSAQRGSTAMPHIGSPEGSARRAAEAVVQKWAYAESATHGEPVRYTLMAHGRLIDAIAAALEEAARSQGGA